MKKIVALVLAMVMVLGLATTAFGAVNTTTKRVGTVDYWMDSTDDDSAAAVRVALFNVAASAPKDADKNGKIEGAEVGNIEYFQVYTTAMQPTKYVKVGSVADADVILYYTNADNSATTDNVFMYLAELDVNEQYAGTGVAFANFGEDCLQYDDEPVDGVKYYTFQNVLYKTVTSSTAATSLMVDGKLVSVEAMAATGWVGHTPKFTYDAKYNVTAVECLECGVAAVIYDNYASVPKAARAVAVPVNADDYYVWTSAPAAPEADTDKVESAQTFDAGIAMYVGMSVMAAAGSAVVLKKKD